MAKLRIVESNRLEFSLVCFGETFLVDFAGCGDALVCIFVGIELTLATSYPNDVPYESLGVYTVGSLGSVILTNNAVVVGYACNASVVCSLKSELVRNSVEGRCGLCSCRVGEFISYNIG